VAATQRGDAVVRLADALAEATRGPRILTIDIECSAHTVRTWGLHDQNIGLNQIVDVGSVICFAAKWYDERKVRFHSDHHDGHEAMVAAAWSLLDECDALVHYNGRAFDVKHLHREFVLAGMPPPSPHKDIDLLTVARSRFKFASNKLDHVAAQLGLGSKTKHSGFDLWTGWEQGDPAAIRKMRQYNRQDVILTEALYDRLRPWIKNHPHPGLYPGGDLTGCPNCGGPMAPTGRTTNTGSRQYALLRCAACGANGRPARATPGTTTGTRAV
jgi:DNA polymerase elongation subunit (family B)